jgi:hypothetical protein
MKAGGQQQPSRLKKPQSYEALHDAAAGKKKPKEERRWK